MKMLEKFMSPEYAEQRNAFYQKILEQFEKSFAPKQEEWADDLAAMLDGYYDGEKDEENGVLCAAYVLDALATLGLMLVPCSAATSDAHCEALRRAQQAVSL